MGGIGSTPRSRSLDLTDRVEERLGKLPVSGRYHRHPRAVTDDYEIFNTILGTGYNGHVYLASPSGTSSSSSQKHAVKVFKLTGIPLEKRSQLESEVEVFLAMDHPHITRLFDVYESEDNMHLVMECLEGGELFDRVSEVKRFSEGDAAHAVWQMLLALNYIHSHGIVHRDLKLENFLYDRKGSSHLKLIDFGFSKAWDPNIKMHVSCGTLSYVAPEVLAKNYTNQCDLWSLGVITFILLSGYMPFSGSDVKQMKDIASGRYKMKPERWQGISRNAKQFTLALLQVNPNKRMSAQEALEHPWLQCRTQSSQEEVDLNTAEALRQFGRASRFRRCCMEMMAWSLSNEERAKVRQHFIAMDTNKHGTITLSELRTVLMNKFSIDDDEVVQIFNALDSNNDEEIHYSDFLAAMLNTRITLHDDLLRGAFKRFDTDASGYITVDNLREVLGESFDGAEVDELLGEADTLEDGRISYNEFAAYITGTPLEKHADAANRIIDTEIIKGGSAEKDRSSRPVSMRSITELPPGCPRRLTSRPVMRPRRKQESAKLGRCAPCGGCLTSIAKRLLRSWRARGRRRQQRRGSKNGFGSSGSFI